MEAAEKRSDLGGFGKEERVFSMARAF